MVQRFQDTMKTLVENSFSEKQITIKSDDKPYFKENLRRLKRQRQREYYKHGRSMKYLELKEKFEEKLKIEKLKYIQKVCSEVVEGSRGSKYPALQRLGFRPGQESESRFVLPEHADHNLSPSQSSEIIANHFSQISQVYMPLKITNLPVTI